MSDGFDFLGFHIQWRRKTGTNKWHVYTFIADRPIRSLKAKIRALTNRTSQQHPRAVLIRLNQIMRGWANYFKHAVCKHTFSTLAHFVWWRVVRWLRTLHRWKWKDVRRRFTTPDGRWKPITADGIELFNLAAVPVTRYRYRGNTIPNPWILPTTPDGRNRGEPGAWNMPSPGLCRVDRRGRRIPWWVAVVGVGCSAYSEGFEEGQQGVGRVGSGRAACAGGVVRARACSFRARSACR